MFEQIAADMMPPEAKAAMEKLQNGQRELLTDAEKHGAVVRTRDGGYRLNGWGALGWVGTLYAKLPWVARRIAGSDAAAWVQREVRTPADAKMTEIVNRSIEAISQTLQRTGVIPEDAEPIRFKQKEITNFINNAGLILMADDAVGFARWAAGSVARWVGGDRVASEVEHWIDDTMAHKKDSRLVSVLTNTAIGLLWGANILVSFKDTIDRSDIAPLKALADMITPLKNKVTSFIMSPVAAQEVDERFLSSPAALFQGLRDGAVSMDELNKALDLIKNGKTREGGVKHWLTDSALLQAPAEPVAEWALPTLAAMDVAQLRDAAGQNPTSALQLAEMNRARAWAAHDLVGRAIAFRAEANHLLNQGEDANQVTQWLGSQYANWTMSMAGQVLRGNAAYPQNFDELREVVSHVGNLLDDAGKQILDQALEYVGKSPIPLSKIAPDLSPQNVDLERFDRLIDGGLVLVRTENQRAIHAILPVTLRHSESVSSPVIPDGYLPVEIDQKLLTAVRKSREPAMPVDPWSASFIDSSQQERASAVENNDLSMLKTGGFGKEIQPDGRSNP